MHIRDNRVYRFCESLYPLILGSNVYVGEMDLHPSPVHPIDMGYDIRTHFKTSVYEKLRNQFLKSFALDVGKYAHLHPLIIMSAVSHTILDDDHAVSLDEHLWNFAGENRITCRGLESMEEQITLLHTIDPKPLYNQLREISANPSGLRRYTSRMLASYIQGDIHHLYHLTKKSMHQLRKRIIYQRNIGMAERITTYDPSLKYFITVGAGHLSGRYGLISKMRKKGWKVKPVKEGRQIS